MVPKPDNKELEDHDNLKESQIPKAGQHHSGGIPRWPWVEDQEMEEWQDMLKTPAKEVLVVCRATYCSLLEWGKCMQAPALIMSKTNICKVIAPLFFFPGAFRT